jgi:two-component system OmpR family sensor kinase
LKSIRRALLVWILGALFLGAVLVTLVTYLVTLEEMNEVFDANLRNVAEAIVDHHEATFAQQHEPLATPGQSGQMGEYEIVTSTWTPLGVRLHSSDPAVVLPFPNRDGSARVQAGGEEWIVHSSMRPFGVGQAAQRLSARKDMASESAAKTIPPLIALIAVIGALLVFALRRGLQPLQAAARDIESRSLGSLNAISTQDAPSEILPLVRSINGLMHRLDVAFTAERRFLADAAHELRTPITALRLQLQWLEHPANDADRTRALVELRSGIDRSQRLVQQLLQMARMSPDGEATQFARVDIASLVRAQVAALSAKAQHAGLDLGADAEQPVWTVGDELQLGVLAENLIENAVRYTPAGGVIDVSAEVIDGSPVLRVVDDGPGIPTEERHAVFERFCRGETARGVAPDGSGLGLAIVKSVAERHDATVELRTPQSGRGLEVRVSFPTA